jgi:hypothetical protein
MLEPIPFAGYVEIDESFDRTASHMACEYVSNTKPVAYAMFRDGEYYDAIHPDEQAKTVGEYDIPLYTHPVKPLTISIVDIDNLVDQFWYSDDAGFHFHYYEFAEAILRKAQEK